MCMMGKARNARRFARRQDAARIRQHHSHTKDRAIVRLGDDVFHPLHTNPCPDRVKGQLWALEVRYDKTAPPYWYGVYLFGGFYTHTGSRVPVRECYSSERLALAAGDE